MDVHPPKYGTIGFDPWPYFGSFCTFVVEWILLMLTIHQPFETDMKCLLSELVKSCEKDCAKRDTLLRPVLALGCPILRLPSCDLHRQIIMLVLISSTLGRSRVKTCQDICNGSPFRAAALKVSLLHQVGSHHLCESLGH